QPGVENLLRLGVKSRKRAGRADQHAHRVRVVVKAVYELLDVLVDQRVVSDVTRPFLQLWARRQFAVQDQVGHFQVTAVLGKLLDGVAAVAQNAAVAVNESDTAPA